MYTCIVYEMYKFKQNLYTKTKENNWSARLPGYSFSYKYNVYQNNHIILLQNHTHKTGNKRRYDTSDATHHRTCGQTNIPQIGRIDFGGHHVEETKVGWDAKFAQDGQGDNQPLHVCEMHLEINLI